MLRRPSLSKRASARSSPSRLIRHSGGVKAPAGGGWITNPKRAFRNQVYYRSTIGVGGAFKLIAGIPSILLLYFLILHWRGILIGCVILFVILPLTFVVSACMWYMISDLITDIRRCNSDAIHCTKPNELERECDLNSSRHLFPSSFSIHDRDYTKWSLKKWDEWERYRNSYLCQFRERVRPDRIEDWTPLEREAWRMEEYMRLVRNSEGQ